MNLDLSNLFDRIETVYPFDGEIEDHDLNELVQDYIINEPIKFSGQIIKTLDGFYMDMNIEYSCESKCARCLKAVKSTVKTSLSGKLEDYEESYSEEVNEDEEMGLDQLKDQPIYYKNGSLALDEYVLMEVTSSLPMRTICSDDCKGLCVKCGIDLNEETCDCDTDFIDPRLEKLKNFVIED